MKIERLDGLIFETMIRGGFKNLCNHEKQINDMNVFPVPDGDTGYNMRRTLENGINHAKSNKHMGCYLKELSKGMLLGARGNSGVILSQLFRGMADELERDSFVDAGELRDALIRAYKTAYSAVIRPVEGTLLTVSREGIENIRSQIRRGTTCDMVMSMYLAEMKKSVRHTPEILAALKEAGVLDSGAVGYITVVDGMTRAMYGEDIELMGETVESNVEKTDFKSEIDANTPFLYGYCMEFLLQLSNHKLSIKDFNLESFIKCLSKQGSSLVVIQSDSIVKVHIHTFSPEKIIEIARQYGEFVSFKLENMQVQHEELEVRKTISGEVAATSIDENSFTNSSKASCSHKKLAIVAVAEGSGISDILRGCGCDIVLEGGQSMNTSSEDFVRAYYALDADRIIVLPNNSNITQSATQAVEISKLTNITIIPTKSVMEGYYALALGSPDIENVDERMEKMKDGANSITTVYIARAVKDYVDSFFSCKRGEYIGLVGKKLISADTDIVKALVKAISSVGDIENKGSFVILKGAKMDENVEARIDEALDKSFPDIDREFLDGGQKIYDVVVGIV